MHPTLSIDFGRGGVSPSPTTQPVHRDLKAELAALDQFGMVMSLKREETLFLEGDQAKYYFKVVSGAVRSCRLLPDGRRHIGDFYLPGDFIALGQSGAYLFTAEAVTEVTLVRYVRNRVDRLIGERPQLGTCLFAMLSEDLSSAQKQMLLLGRKTALEKLASFLLTMADREGAGDHVGLPMTRADIADYLGLTIETVSRTLSQLKTARVIALRGAADIHILDREHLQELAGDL